MNPTLNLSIPRPCDQKWDSFQKTRTGGHCTSCNKVVIDFTVMSDAQITSYFKNNTAHTCGRFRPEQLKQYIATKLPSVNPGLLALRAGLVSLLLLIVSKPASAQERPTKADTVLVEERNPVEIKNFDGVFSGLVRDQYGEALPGVSVLLKGTTYGTVTDMEGKFEAPVALKPGDVLVFSFIGYTTKEIQLKHGDERGFQAPLQLCLSEDIMGEIAVHQLYEEPSVLQKVMARIGKLF